MKIALSGYRGLIGSSLEEELIGKGHSVVRLSREVLYDFRGDTLSGVLKGTDAVVHLSGAPIIKRWTEKNRKEIYDSRIITTRNLVQALRKIEKADRPNIFISASAIGIYESGSRHTEASTKLAGNFAAQIIKDWEQASANLPEGVRRVIFRIGLVLDRRAILIRQLRLPFLLFAGGPIGNGKQPFPFVHLQDVTGAIRWALESGSTSGIYNLVAPEEVTNGAFSKAFGKQLRRPSWFPVPRLPLKLMFGKAAQLVYESPAVVPERLLTEGYPFRYPTLAEALGEIEGA